jgi:molybdopterin synthase catalytic subunit
MSVRIQRNEFDLADEMVAITADRTDIGAVVSFTGRCRDEGGTLLALELEHYPGMAEREIKRIARTARDRWPLQGLSVIHRYGRIEPGQDIVLVLAASVHRKAAFEAASYVMDFLKTRAPFWKKQHTVHGAGDWVDAREIDDQALDRWREDPD